MITAVTGTPGSGKSFRAVHSIADALRRGKYVITNVALVDGWQELLATAGLRGRLRKLVFPEAHRRRVAFFDRHLFYAPSLDELMRVRVVCARCGRRHGTSAQARQKPSVFCNHAPKEGRALAVVDEAYKWLNNRGDLRSEDRFSYVEWFKLHRKLGIDVELIEQHFDAIDKQVRDLVEFIVRLRNLRNARIMGVRLIPFNLFLAVHVWNQGPVARRHVARREVYLLDGTRRLYDTFATFHGVDALADDDVIWLGGAA